MSRVYDVNFGKCTRCGLYKPVCCGSNRDSKTGDYKNAQCIDCCTYTRTDIERDNIRLNVAERILKAIGAPKLLPATLDAKARKERPLATGVLDYFPDALMEVAYCSKVGNDQHNPGEPLHWAKEKSTDEPDALLRHLVDRGKRDTDGVRHSAKVAWRALALLQREIDAERKSL